MSALERPLRIALFHNLPFGGARRHTYEQLREMSRRVHEIEEFTFSTSNRDFLPWPDFVRQTHVYPLTWKPLEPFPVPGVGPYAHLLQNLANLRRLDRVARLMAADIDRGGFDLVFAKDCMFTLAPQIMRYTGTPCVFYAHSMMENNPSQADRRANAFTAAPIYLGSRLVRRLDLANTRRARLVLTNSHFTRERLRRSHNVDAQVVHPGVDAELFRPVPEPREAYVLSAGTVNEEKGHRLILEALANLPADRRPRLLVAGDQPGSPEADYLRGRARELGVELEIASFASAVELARIYARARLVAFAPLNEPLGLVVLEAMACGTPVIGVKQGGLLDTIVDGETGLLAERTTASLTKALLALLDDPERAEAMGRAGRARVESYWTWQRAVDDLEAQFARVLGHSVDGPERVTR
jgi:glycosyltransferase involved in cell wall biosynthesis